MKKRCRSIMLIGLCLALILGAAACAGDATENNASAGSRRAGSSVSEEKKESNNMSENEISEETASSETPVSGTPLPDTVAFRPASANQKVKNLKILFTGDSLTEGDGTISGYRYQAVKALYAAGITFETVGPYNKDAYEKRIPKRYGLYGGRCGWKIADIFNRKEQIFDCDFDAVCMMIGYNDKATAIADVNLGYYKQIIDYIYQKNANAAVFLMGVAPSYQNIDQPTTFTHARFNEKVKAFAEQYAAAGKKAYYVDTWASDEWNADTCFTDTVHFNETGNGIVASCLAKVAVPVLKEMNVADSSYTLPVSPSSITLDQSAVSLVAHAGFGEGALLKATVSPADAEMPQVVWGSSDRNVATVDEFGTVRGVGAGTCTVTAYTLDGGKTATCTVTVTDKKNDTTVFNDNMASADTWEGGGDPANFRFGKYRTIDSAKETAPFVSKKTVDTGHCFYLSTSVRCYSGSGSANAGTLDVSIDSLTLRLKGKGYACQVLVDGKTVCEWSGGTACLDRAEFGVMVENGNLTLMRNGVPVANGTIADRSFSGNVSFFNQLPFKTMIRFIRVATW